MPFRIFQDFSWYDSSSNSVTPDPSYYAALGIEKMITPYNQFTPLIDATNPTYTLNVANIWAAADYYASLGWYLTWDIEGYDTVIKIDQRIHTDAEIDATLDMLKDIYDLCKARQPSLPVGFYGFPPSVDIESYYSIFGLVNPGNAFYIDNYYNSFLPAIQRLNKRWNGSSYDDLPMTSYMDYATPSIYPRYFGASGMYEWDVYASGLISLVKSEFPGIPIYAYLHWFSVGGPWVGKPANTSEMRQMMEFARDNCDGMVMWGGFASSDDYYHMIFEPDGSKTLSDWQAISSGTFRLSVDGVEIEPTGLNFTAATGFNQIANIIATGINNYISSVVDPHLGQIVTPISYYYPQCYPYNIGPVSFVYATGAYNPPEYPIAVGPHFKYNSSGGMLKTPPGTVAPPDQREYKNGYTVVFSSVINTGSIPGWTDIGTASYIGTRLSPEYFRRPRNSNEYENGWALGTEWYTEFLRFANETLESFLLVTCSPMWPDLMWPTMEWPTDEWPTCASILSGFNCTVNFRGIDLVSTMQFNIDMASVSSGIIDILSNKMFVTDLYSSITLTADFDYYQSLETNIVEVPSGQTNLLQSAQLPTNVLGYASGIINIISVPSGDTNLISYSSGILNTLGVYNIPTVYCKNCSQCPCCC